MLGLRRGRSLRRHLPQVITVAIALGVIASPAAARTQQCGAVKGFENGTITRVTTTSGTCVAARITAKKYARTATSPRGYACRQTSLGMTKAKVTCTRTGRRITFTVAWRARPLPAAPALPS